MSYRVIILENKVVKPVILDAQTEETGNSSLKDCSHALDENSVDVVKRKRIFREDWLTAFPWLAEVNGQSYCKVCLKTLSNLKANLERHESLEYHKQKVIEKKNQFSIQDFLGDKGSSSKTVKNAELTLVMFCIEHNLPFMLMDFLPDLIKKVCEDSKVAKNIQCGRTKATKLTKEVLGHRGIQDVAMALRSSRFSIIIDETTDISCVKALVLVARVYDNNIEAVRDRFVGLIKLPKADSETIFNSIVQHLESLHIPLTNLIGLATDGASVMAGELKGVQARFKEIIPNLFFMKCICHSLHLCASYACKSLPANIEHLAKDIYNFFAHSAKKHEEFREFQEFFSVKSHKILAPSKTRWLSLESVVNRILEQWSALKLYFVSCTFENISASQAKTIAEELDNPANKVYFFFLSYILKIVNTMNIEFQSQSLRIHKLFLVMESNFKIILSNFISLPPYFEISEIDVLKENNYLPLDEIYMGMDAYEFIENNEIGNEKLNEIRQNVLVFYIELAKQIQKRFNFQDKVLKMLSVIDPEIALNINSSLIPLLQLFPNLVDSSKEVINTEWRALKYTNINIADVENPEKFWAKVSKIKNGLNEESFKNVSAFIKDLMSFPHSSAAAERRFSELNLIKTKKSNRFNLDTVNAIMASKELLNSDYKGIWTP